MRSPKTSLTLAVLAAAWPSLASADDTGLRRCRGLAESTARLACYDALPLGQPAPPRVPAPPPGSGPARAAPPAAAPAGAAAVNAEARFGLERQAPVAELPAVESHIPGLFEGWGPNTRIRLANGQVWQIADDSSRLLERRDPKVTVRRAAFGAFFLDFEGDNRSPRVRRVQ